MRNLFGEILSRRLYSHPIFVVGDGRSGTSVLLQALGKHPLILDSPGEAPLLTSMGGTAALFEFGEAATRRHYNESLPMSKAYLYDRLRNLSFEIAFGANYGIKFFAKKFTGNPSQFLKKRCWAAKTFPSELVAQGLKVLYPSARILYIIRNGMEVVQSKTKFHGFRENDFEVHCRQWKTQIEKYSYMDKCTFAMKVRHENLVRNPDNFFSEVFSFLGIDYHENPSNFVKSNLVHPLDQATKVGIDAQRAILDRSEPSKSWTEERKEIFRSICAGPMSDNGYIIDF